MVYENKSASVIQLKGKANERGLYECRWKNSRAEARHRNFTVTYSGEEPNDTYTTIIAVTIIGLLAVGIGIGTKLYFDKVRKK
jgi:hypothetical protein